MAIERGIQFDMEEARQAVSDFADVTGISVMLVDADGKQLFRVGKEDVCAMLAQAIGQDFQCSQLHGRSVADALRFGGRYIYSCPMGFAFLASPIMDAGALAGAFVAGPVSIMEDDDQLSGSDYNVYEASEQVVCAAKEALTHAPRKTFDELKVLSRVLFANAVYISDSKNALMNTRRENDSQNAVYNYIDYLKRSDGDRVPYPMETEQELFKTIVRGDQEMASILLNQILGHIYFYAMDNEEVYARIQELLVVLMRAVACSGADVAQILEMSRRYQREMRSLRTQDQLTAWLASSLRALMNQVADVADSKHSFAINKAIGYIKQKYALSPSLEEVAEYAGYSPAYFSRIFREDTGMTFSEFLNEVRIEKSKSLLLTTSLSIADISSMLGYNDQSYFCRIFKQVTGTTPDRYRKRSRRIDYEKEYATTGI